MCSSPELFPHPQASIISKNRVCKNKSIDLCSWLRLLCFETGLDRGPQIPLGINEMFACCLEAPLRGQVCSAACKRSWHLPSKSVDSLLVRVYYNIQYGTGCSVTEIKIGLAWELALEKLGTLQAGPMRELCPLQTHEECLGPVALAVWPTPHFSKNNFNIWGASGEPGFLVACKETHCGFMILLSWHEVWINYQRETVWHSKYICLRQWLAAVI